MSQMEVTGCVNVQYNRIASDLNVAVSNKNTSLKASAENVNGIAVDYCNRNKNLNVNTILVDLGKVTAVNANKELNVTFGIVCSVVEGFAVLYASDGALITIDNNYLIVEDER